MSHSAVLATKKHGVPYATHKQLEVLRFIQSFQDKNGVSPTLEEIAKFRGVNKVAIYVIINQLEKKGWIAREKFRWRSIQLLYDVPKRKENLIFSSGSIKAREISNSEVDSDDSLKIFMGADIYLISDESLASKDITCGDHIIVQNVKPRVGDIILIEINGSVKIKSYKLEYKDHAIRGVVTGIIRPF